jgi:hypothetical protein
MQSLSAETIPERFKYLRWVVEDNHLFDYIPIY